MSYQIIPILLEEHVLRYAYLILSNHISILIDPGAKHHTQKLIPALNQHINVSKLDYIILQSNDYLNLTCLDDLNDHGFNGKIIANETGLPYLKTIVKSEILTLESIDYHLEVDDALTLEFVTLPFLPFPEGFVTIIKESKTLFSAHLLSQSIHQNQHTEELLSSINHFHEMVLPSVEFVRHAIKKLKKYKIKLIYPRLGYHIEEPIINDICRRVSTYDFYNTNQVIDHKSKKNVAYNYETICNHMLKVLETKFHRKDILDIFDQSEIKLELYPHLEIESTELTGYKLWNGFFDLIYQKKGVLWLTLLEPVVRKYNQTYHIKLPSIYKTKFIAQQSQLEDLTLVKKELQAEVKELSNTILSTTDKMLRCPITNLYNQRFMTEHLFANLDQDLSDQNTRGLILIQIDQLLEINKKYGIHQGDETLKHIVHLIHNIKSDDTLVFKQKGPGIFIYKHDVSSSVLLEFVLKLSNYIKQSDLFVEPITLSASIVEIGELTVSYALEERVSQLIELTQMRLERAKLKGKGQILDQHNDEKTYVEGIILLVDEDETYQNLMVKIFNRIHYKVIIAKDIYEAYEQLETHNIDVIISEINLSKLDGFQLKLKINLSQTFKNIPFIIVSHHKNLDVVMRCNLLDVDLILQKPMIPEEIIGHIKRIRDRKVIL